MINKDYLKFKYTSSKILHQRLEKRNTFSCEL